VIGAWWSKGNVLAKSIKALGQRELTWSLEEIVRFSCERPADDAQLRPMDYVARGGAGAIPAPAARHRGPSGRRTGGGALQSVMAPKRNVDKGKAPMVEEEPRGPRTR
ncbi:hypothetical protein ACLOJK_035048, partial [Asimina triloba]